MAETDLPHNQVTGRGRNSIGHPVAGHVAEADLARDLVTGRGWNGHACDHVAGHAAERDMTCDEVTGPGRNGQGGAQAARELRAPW